MVSFEIIFCHGCRPSLGYGSPDAHGGCGRYVRGLCKFELGDMDKAMDHYKRALRGNPDHTNSRTQLKRVKGLAQTKEAGRQAWASGK